MTHLLYYSNKTYTTSVATMTYFNLKIQDKYIGIVNGLIRLIAVKYRVPILHTTS